MTEASACAICGVAVFDMGLHASFHSMLDAVATMADEADTDATQALAVAEHAANILYQRGID